jgi:hypothetical protein
VEIEKDQFHGPPEKKIGENQAQGAKAAPQPAPDHQVYRQGPEGHGQGLDDEQHSCIAPYPVSGGDENEDGMKVIPEEGGDQAHGVEAQLEPGQLPHVLVENTQVPAVGLEIHVLEKGNGAVQAGEKENEDEHGVTAQPGKETGVSFPHGKIFRPQDIDQLHSALNPDSPTCTG